VRSWLAPDGPLLHAFFTHRRAPICSITADGKTGSAHFFTGGVMPSHHLVANADLSRSRLGWRWSGTHYQRTAGFQWLGNFDSTATRLKPFFARSTQRHELMDAALARFFLAPQGCFGLRRRHEMGRQPFQDEGGVTAVVTLGQWAQYLACLYGNVYVTIDRFVRDCSWKAGWHNPRLQGDGKGPR